MTEFAGRTAVVHRRIAVPEHDERDDVGRDWRA